MKIVTLIALLVLTAGAVLADSATNAWAPGVIAQVNGVALSESWYANELRSTFFRYAGAPDVRQRVMSNLVDRMLLYSAALEGGVTNDPAVQQKLAERLKSVEEFQRFQLDMARIGFLIEAYLEQHPPAGSDPVTADELRAYYQKEIAGKPGAPATFDDVPAALQSQIRQQVEGQRREAVLRDFVSGLRTQASIRVQTPMMERTALPHMTGAVPDAFKAKP